MNTDFPDLTNFKISGNNHKRQKSAMCLQSTLSNCLGNAQIQLPKLYRFSILNAHTNNICFSKVDVSLYRQLKLSPNNHMFSFDWQWWIRSKAG